MAEKRYYWLKLKDDYFTNPKIKKLRKIAGGDTYTIIYLKMQLASVKTEGIISYEGIEPTFEEELALKLDEEVEDVQMTLAYLKAQGLVEENNNDYLFLEANNNIGSEGQSAERKRRFDAKKNKLALRGNASVTQVERSSLSNSISNIFNSWNNLNIIKHKELSDKLYKVIEKSLKIYSEEQIITYMERYNTLLLDKDYFFEYKWTLDEFLSRKEGISSFTDEGSKWLNYVKFLDKEVEKDFGVKEENNLDKFFEELKKERERRKNNG